MKRWLAPLLALIAGPAQAVDCSTTSFDAVQFSVCEVTAGEDLRLFLRDGDGRVLGDFAAVEAMIAPRRLAFAMNAGMFHDDLAPVGLFRTPDGEEGTLSDGGGYGNFGLLPNGVLCIGQTVRVIEREAFVRQAPACDYVTQSGPMLVIDGALHPRLLPDSASRYIRNGVGTSADGSRAVFAVSDQPVNFHTFARLFRDHLGLPQALFLDGNVSRLYAPALGRHDIGRALGPIVGVVD